MKIFVDFAILIVPTPMAHHDRPPQRGIPLWTHPPHSTVLSASLRVTQTSSREETTADSARAKSTLTRFLSPSVERLRPRKGSISQRVRWGCDDGDTERQRDRLSGKTKTTSTAAATRAIDGGEIMTVLSST